MRDYSHGPARKEKTKDYGSFRLMVDSKLRAMTGMGVAEFGFKEPDIRSVMQFSSAEAADILLRGTDYSRTRHG